jgi:hypothetical protein
VVIIGKPATTSGLVSITIFHECYNSIATPNNINPPPTTLVYTNLDVAKSQDVSLYFAYNGVPAGATCFKYYLADVKL